MDWPKINAVQFIQEYPERTDPKFSYKIARLKEFADLKLPITEAIPTEPGIPLLHQEIVRRFFSPHTDYKSSLILHSLGSGKCVLPDTVVPTNTGTFTVDQLWNSFSSNLIFNDGVGEWSHPSKEIKVWSYNEKLGTMVAGRVGQLYRQYINEKIVKLTLNDGSNIRITRAHHLYNGTRWTNEFAKGDFICVPKKLNFDAVVPQNENLIYLMAWQISEGHERANKPTLSISQKDRDILITIKQKAEALFRQEGIQAVPHIYEGSRGKCPYLQISSIGYQQYLEKKGYTWGSKSAEKKIPDFIVYSPIDQCRLFLRNYFDADGSVYNGRVSVSSASYDIVHKLSLMLRRFGIWLRIRKTKKAATNGSRIKRLYYEGILSRQDSILFKEVIGFGMKRKHEKIFPCNNPNTNVHIVPCRDFLKRVIDEFGISCKFIGWNYVHGNQNPSVTKLEEACKNLEKSFGDPKIMSRIQELRHLKNRQLLFPKIQSIEIEHYKGWVYDLEIDVYHNYVANNIICHNTCTSGLVAEYFKDTQVSGDKRNPALVLVKNEDLARNYSMKIADVCTNTVYYGKLVGGETEDLRTKRIRKEVEKVYEIQTWEAFLSQMKKRNKEWISRHYSNRVIIIDEAHHLNVAEEEKGKKTQKKIYKDMKRFLHLVKDCRVLLLTGTPIWDRAREIASLLNLILPEDEQLPIGKTFERKYFEKGRLKPDALNELKDKLRGRISFLRTSLTNRIDTGFTNPWLQIIKVYPDGMSDFQYRNSRRIEKKEKERHRGQIKEQREKKERIAKREKGKEKVSIRPSITVGAWKQEKKVGIRRWSREAANFIYPDLEKVNGRYKIKKNGLWGFEGFKKYAGGKKRGTSTDYRLLPSWVKDSEGATPEKIRLNREFVRLVNEDLKKFSAKIASMVDQIRRHPNQLIYIFTGEFVEASGSGAVQIAALLEILLNKTGKQEFHRILTARGIKRKSAPGTRGFAVITGNAPGTTTRPLEVRRILENYGHPRNRYADYCQVLIGSQRLAEGVDIKNVRQVHILMPHWNLPGIRQAIGRVFRVGSHDDLKLEERNVTVFHHAAVQTAPQGKGYHRGGGFPAGVGFTKMTTTDIEIYRIAEIKETENAEVYRLLKEMAWDCPLNYRRNVLTTDQPGSQVCDYRECNYVCDGFPPTSKIPPVWEYNVSKEKIRRDNYDLFYASPEIERLKKEIVKVFHSYFSLPLEGLVELLSVEEDQIVLLLQALDDIIENRQLIRNRYGFSSYLKEKGDVYFLDNQIDPIYSYQTALYTEYPLVTDHIGLEEVVELSQLEKDRKILRQFARTGDMKQYTQLSKSGKILILEWGAALKESERKGTKVPTSAERKVLKAVERDLSENFHYMSDGSFLHTLEDDIKIYEPETGKWIPISPKETKIYQAELEKQKKKKEEAKARDIWQDNPYGFLGLVTNGKFKILTKETLEKKAPTKRKPGKPTGRVCRTIKKPHLIGFFLKLGYYPKAPPGVGEGFTKKELIGSIKSKPEYTKYTEVFPNTPLKSLSKDRVLRIYYLYTLDIPKLCRKLEEWFRRPENRKFLLV